MTKPTKSPAEPSFEKALAELESIVEKMEDGGLSLEQSLAAHKRGLELAKQCRERLESAQQQVRALEDFRVEIPGHRQLAADRSQLRLGSEGGHVVSA